jgi:hypothetical protein
MSARFNRNFRIGFYQAVKQPRLSRGTFCGANETSSACVTRV